MHTTDDRTFRRYITEARHEEDRCARILRELYRAGHDIGEQVYDDAADELRSATREREALEREARASAASICLDGPGGCDGPESFYGAATVCRAHARVRRIY